MVNYNCIYACIVATSQQYSMVSVNFKRNVQRKPIHVAVQRRRSWWVWVGGGGGGESPTQINHRGGEHNARPQQFVARPARKAKYCEFARRARQFFFDYFLTLAPPPPPSKNKMDGRPWALRAVTTTMTQPISSNMDVESQHTYL